MPDFLHHLTSTTVYEDFLPDVFEIDTKFGEIAGVFYFYKICSTWFQLETNFISKLK